MIFEFQDKKDNCKYIVDFNVHNHVIYVGKHEYLSNIGLTDKLSWASYLLSIRYNKIIWDSNLNPPYTLSIFAKNYIEKAIKLIAFV